MSNENADLVQMEISKKQLVGRFVDSKSNLEMARILLPDAGTIIRPANKLYEKKEDPDRYVFYLPKDFEILVSYSKKREGENLPPEKLYERIVKKKNPEEIRKILNNDNEFVVISFSKKQLVGKFLTENGKEMGWILGADQQRFTRPMEQIRQSRFDPEKLYVSLPKKIEVDGVLQDYRIMLYKSVRKEGVTEDTPKTERYDTVKREVTAEELKEVFSFKNKEKKEDYVKIHIDPEDIIARTTVDKVAMVSIEKMTVESIPVVFQLRESKLRTEDNGFHVIFKEDTQIPTYLKLEKNETTGIINWSAKELAEALDFEQARSKNKGR